MSDSEGTGATNSIQEQEDQNGSSRVLHLPVRCRMYSILLEKEGMGGTLDVFGRSFGEKSVAGWRWVCLADLLCPLLKKTACDSCSAMKHSHT